MPHEWEALANDPEVKPLLTRTVDGREVPITYMRYAQRESEGREVAELDQKLSDPFARRFLQNPGKLKQQNDRRKANLLAQSPPSDLRASQRDKLKKLESVTRAFVAEGMPTAEQMRHNPPGAVDHHRAWDKATKRALLCWKKVRIVLNPDSDATDLGNFERYRPTNAATRELYTDAQIPGQFALGPQAKANYAAINWDSPEVAEQIERLIAEGKVKVRVRGAPRRGAPGHAKTLAEHACGIDGCETVYRGPFGPSNLRKHRAKVHGVREEVSA